MRPEDSAWESLRFQSWHSAPDVSFWQKLASLKLNQFQLNDQPQDIMGYFTPGRSSTVPARLTVDDSAFILSESTLSSSFVARTRYEWKAPGVLYNTNTMEAFKSLDKNAVMQKAGERLMARMTEHPLNDSWDFLNSFVLITFADLKKHSFLYWFGFVTASTSTPMLSRPPVAVSTVLSVQEQREVMHGLMHLRSMNADGSAPVLNFPSFFVISRTQTQGIRVYSFETWRQEPPDDSMDLLFGFVDPCPLQTNPGWPLRNYLALLASLPSNKASRNRPLTVLSFREHVRHTLEPDDTFEWTSSLVFSVQTGNEFVFERETVKFLGWEPNARGKMGPRLMELSALLDPIRLAEQSVDLNLKLMLWRQLPMLQLDQLATTKCLVLGAGTLGCFTARSLLSWGFRNITMVDNSVVSHSNPVRQPLFEFNDVGKPKAACAAASLKRIFPLVNATAVHLSIPMAGHALSNEVLVKEAQEALQTLVELITSHDVVFLGTDSRESRWLPTVICAAQEKILLNSALGFDSYLVMRHGIGATKDAPSSLGCYFCNDIVSPRDSLKDRTLDQMCTVTRPGLAPIAAATAVELLVAVLHSPDGVRTSAEKPNDTSSSLGFVPHQLRGFLNSFATMVITGEAFDKCIACSEKVQAEYRADPFGLLQYACNSVTYLEELTGLHTLTQAADSFMDELEEESDEDSLL